MNSEINKHCTQVIQIRLLSFRILPSKWSLSSSSPIEKTVNLLNAELFFKKNLRGGSRNFEKDGEGGGLLICIQVSS